MIKELAALPDLGSIPITHRLTIRNSSSNVAFWPQRTSGISVVHIHTCRHSECSSTQNRTEQKMGLGRQGVGSDENWVFISIINPTTWKSKMPWVGTQPLQQPALGALHVPREASSEAWTCGLSSCQSSSLRISFCLQTGGRQIQVFRPHPHS